MGLALFYLLIAFPSHHSPFFLSFPSTNVGHNVLQPDPVYGKYLDVRRAKEPEDYLYDSFATSETEKFLRRTFTRVVMAGMLVLNYLFLTTIEKYKVSVNIYDPLLPRVIPFCHVLSCTRFLPYDIIPSHLVTLSLSLFLPFLPMTLSIRYLVAFPSSFPPSWVLCPLYSIRYFVDSLLYLST